MTSPCKGIQSKESTLAIESASCRVSSCMADISTGTYGHFICRHVYMYVFIVCTYVLLLMLPMLLLLLKVRHVRCRLLLDQFTGLVGLVPGGAHQLVASKRDELKRGTRISRANGANTVAPCSQRPFNAMTNCSSFLIISPHLPSPITHRSEELGSQS